MMWEKKVLEIEKIVEVGERKGKIFITIHQFKFGLRTIYVELLVSRIVSHLWPCIV